jgi:hypothetical protein
LVLTGARKTFEPDYICFIAYAMGVLLYLRKYHPETEKVDFIVETNGPVTDHIREFHFQLECALDAIGKASLAPLVGTLISGGKERVSLQAADVLCWNSARRQARMLDAVDAGRYSKIAIRRGHRHKWSNKDIHKIAHALNTV